MTFGDLQQQLIAMLREKVRNGELSERGLARLLGISQPHIHHVLQGKRGFSLETSDRILRNLRVDVRDLVEREGRSRQP